MKTFAFFVLAVLSCNCISQNLIKNGDFEDYTICPQGYTKSPIDTLIPHWFIPSQGTPDYYNFTCPMLDSSFYDNTLIPCSGKGCAGLYLGEMPLINTSRLSTKTNQRFCRREYITGELNLPLQKDSVYVLTFKYFPANHSYYYIDSIGVFFSKGRFKKKREEILKFKPQLIEKVDSNNVRWSTFSAIYTASGKERFFTIGNFKDDFQTKYYDYISSHSVMYAKGAYFYIDNVILSKLKF